MKATLLVSVLALLDTLAAVHAQPIQDPARDGAEPGRTYLVWKVDINGDGILDMLVTEKPSADEIEDQQHIPGPQLPADSYPFAVYLGLANGKGYTKAGGVDVEMSHCYVGLIRQLKKYGLVTLDTQIVDDPETPQAKHGVLKKRISAFVLSKRQMRRTNLTPLIANWEKNSIYKSYFSGSKRTDVQLEAVTP